MSKILNLTQHDTTADQLEDGVFEPDSAHKAEIRRLLTFETLPAAAEITWRAEDLARLASTYGVTQAMIGGAPFLMTNLAARLNDRGIEGVYAFSIRESEERPDPKNPDRVIKVNVFRHRGFVRPSYWHKLGTQQGDQQ